MTLFQSLQISAIAFKQRHYDLHRTV